MELDRLIAFVATGFLIYLFYAVIGSQGSYRNTKDQRLYRPHRLFVFVCMLNFPLLVGVCLYSYYEYKVKVEVSGFFWEFFLVWLFFSFLAVQQLLRTRIELGEFFIVYTKGKKVVKIDYTSIEGAFISFGILHLIHKERDKKGGIVYTHLPAIFENMPTLVHNIDRRLENNIGV